MWETSEGENFRELVKIAIFHKENFCGENFHRLLTFAMPVGATLPNFTEKTFTNSHRNVKFEVFSLETFLLHGKSGELCVSQIWWCHMPCLASHSHAIKFPWSRHHGNLLSNAKSKCHGYTGVSCAICIPLSTIQSSGMSIVDCSGVA